MWLLMGLDVQGEMCLEQMYGKEYDEYKKKTIIGIPFIS